MAIEFVESFDQQFPNNFSPVLLQWDSNEGGVTADIDGFTSVVLDSGTAIRIGASASITKFLPAVTDRYISLFFRSDDVTDTKPFITLLSDTSTICELQFNAVSQNLELVVNSVVEETSTTVFINSIVYNLQIRLFIDGATGVFEVKIDDSVETVTFTGDTLVAALTTTNRLKLGTGVALAPSIYFDSIITDDAAYPGVVRMLTKFPNADGNYTTWAKSTGSLGFALVDEVPPNNTDYVSSQTDAEFISFTFPDHGLTGATVVAVVRVFIGKVISSGQVKIGVRRGEGGGGSDFMGSAQTPGVNNTHLEDILIQDPSTSLAWVLADINDMELVLESEIV